MNLPETINFTNGTITFLYDANGNKLSKTVSTGVQKDYLGGIEYNNGAVEAVYHEEGRATPSGTSWQYEYYLKDHLGNTRVIFTDSDNNGEPEIIQEADYYPFGMRHDRSITATNHYLYNGKELNTDLGLDWYDYGARWLDVETGRWSTIDPMAESYTSMSPFNYVANNPISNIDPDGRFIIPFDDIFLDARGNEIGRIKNNLPDRYFTEHTSGSYSFNKFADTRFIQIHSPNTLRGDIKDGHRHNEWNGTIDILPTLTARRLVEEGAKKVRDGKSYIHFMNIVTESKEKGGIDYVNHFKDGIIYDIQGIYYNSHEALNLLWGAALGRLGMMPEDAKLGAGVYHFYAWWTKGNRYADAGPINETNHVEAIFMGFNLYDDTALMLLRRNPALYSKYALDIKILNNNKERDRLRQNMFLYGVDKYKKDWPTTLHIGF